MEPLTREERKKLWLRWLLRLLAAGAAVWAVPRLLLPALSLLLPFLLALLCAWLLSPAARWLQKKLRLSRPAGAALSVLLTFGVAGGGLAALLWSAGREVWDLLQHWQELWETLSGSLSALTERLTALSALLPKEAGALLEGLFQSLGEQLDRAVPALFSALARRAADAAMGLPSFFLSLMVFLLATYFITASLPSFRLRWQQSLSRSGRVRLSVLRTVTLSAFGGYLRAQLLLSLGVFLLLLPGFTLLRQPYALLLSVLLSVLDFIPIVGSGTAMVPWAVVSFCFGDRARAVGIFLLWAAVALFRQIAEPRVLGGQTGLSPLVSLLSVYVGLKLWGVAGMILTPVLCLVVRGLISSGAADGLIADGKLLLRDLASLWDPIHK